jgi:DNA-binding transcriptional MerR regulator
MFKTATYQISDVEKIIGIKAHTIRIWESRYNIVTPKRTETNIRFYDEIDLRKLLMISLLNRAGLKISEIATFSDAELKEKVNIQYKISSDYQAQIDALMLAVNDLDEQKFEKIFNQILLHNGFENAINLIIEPFFEQIEILWSTNSINTAQKKYIFHLINQKIISASNNEIINETTEKKRFAIFTPLGINENLIINFYSYYIKKAGIPTLFLGSNLPVSDLVKINQIKSFSNILTVLPYNYQCIENDNFVDFICKQFENKKIFVIDYKKILSNNDIYNNLLLINTFDTFKNFLKLI